MSAVPFANSTGPILAPDGKPAAGIFGACCYLQAFKCTNDAPSNFWMFNPTFGIFKYQGTCYKFGTSAFCLPAGATLLTPAQVQPFASCAACAGSGVPCAACIGGLSPQNILCTVTGLPDCSPTNLDASADVSWAAQAIAALNGSYLLPAIGGCFYLLSIQPFTGATIYPFSTSGCDGESDQSQQIDLVYDLNHQTMNIQVVYPHTTEIVFSSVGTQPTPYDCFATVTLQNQRVPNNDPSLAIPGQVVLAAA